MSPLQAVLAPLLPLFWAFLPGSAPAAGPAPFGPGEVAEYRISLGPFGAGRARMALDTASLGGRLLWRATLDLKAGVPFYRVRDHYSSHFDPHTLSSARYEQDIRQGSYARRDVYDLDTVVASSAILDDISIFYYVRTLPLSLPRTVLSGYFRPDRNPLTVDVLGKETISTSIGPVRAIVVRPFVGGRKASRSGLFRPQSNTRVWLTDDARRLIVRMSSDLAVGALRLELASFSPPRP